MMKNFLFVSLIGFCIMSGCSSVRSGCRYAGEYNQGLPEWKGIINPGVGINKFNLQIDIARHHFSGLLLVKQLSPQHHRTVFTTHFGLRVFDLEFLGDSLQVHYCLEPMNKEKVIGLFKNDFSRLWGLQGQEDRKVKIYKDRKTKGGKGMVYQTDSHLFYRKNPEENQMERITSGRGWNKTSWIFKDFHAGYPSAIYIHHALWPIKLELTRLED